VLRRRTELRLDLLASLRQLRRCIPPARQASLQAIGRPPQSDLVRVRDRLGGLAIGQSTEHPHGLL
jgi:hypothetical protein